MKKQTQVSKKKQPQKALSNKQQKPKQRLEIDYNTQVQEQPMFPIISKSSHPWLAFIYVVVKIGAVVIYFIFPWFLSTLTVCQIVIIIQAIDFWIIKNLAGRLLVGLRWWVDFDQNGQQHWKFQCKANQNQANPANQKIFWWTLALFCLIWVIILFINVISLDIQKGTAALFCCVILIFNFYSFYKCSKVQSQNIKKLATQYGQEMAQKFMAGVIVANYF